MNNKSELPPNTESGVETTNISLAARDKTGDLFEVDVAGVQVEKGKVIGFTQDIFQEHYRPEEDLLILVEQLKSMGVHGYYVEWTTEEQEDIPGELYIYASDLNRALQSRYIEITEDPENPGSYDLKTDPEKKYFYDKLRDTHHF